MNLRKMAKDQKCQVRSPCCNWDTETTVLAHVRISGISGLGLKAPDVLGAWACAPCHALCDTGQYMGTRLERDDRELIFLRGVMRTQYALIKLGAL